MVFLDGVRAFEGSTIVCDARVRPDAPYVRGGSLATVVLLEHMAQAMATWYGLSPREGSVQKGYVVAVPDLTLRVPSVKAGDVLEVEAVRQWDDGTLGEFCCAVRRGDEEIARATLLVVRRASPEETSPP